jgi:hypothetical protein
MAYVGTYLALTAAFFLLLHLTGHAASRRLWAPLAPHGLAEALLVRTAMGAAIWVALLFALAALQMLRPLPIWVAIAAIGAWGLQSWLRDRHQPSASGGGHRGPWGRRLRGWVREPLALLVVTVLVVVYAALFAQALRPIVAWDADVYHLTVPRLYLEHGGFRRIPFNVYSNWPLAVQLLFALAMTWKDYVLATAVHYGFGVLLAISTGALVARVATPTWGAIAAGLLTMHPVFLYEIRVAYVDVACAFFLFAAFVALHRALEDPGAERGFMLAAGIACGVLAAAKLNGIFGAVAVATVYVASRLHGGAPARSLRAPLLAFAAPVAALGVPWLLKTWWLTGNPVYPLLHGVFGGPEWSEGLARAHRAWQRSIGMGRAPLDYVLLPFRVLFLGGEGYPRFDGRLHPLLGVLLPVALIGARHHALARRALGVAAAYFVLWAATSQQMRFLIPVLPLLAVAVAVSGHALSARAARAAGRVTGAPGGAAVRGLTGAAAGAAPRRERGAGEWLPELATAVVAVAVATLLLRASGLYLEQAPRLYAALGSRGDALRAHATDEVYAVIHERTPADAKLLFVNVNRGFFCPREYLADSFFEASQVAALLHQLGDRDGIRRGLEERGITHVLVERQEGGPRYPSGFVELLEDPSSRVVYRSPDARLTLFALTPTHTGSS